MKLNYLINTKLGSLTSQVKRLIISLGESKMTKKQVMQQVKLSSSSNVFKYHEPVKTFDRLNLEDGRKHIQAFLRESFGRNMRILQLSEVVEIFDHILIILIRQFYEKGEH